MSSGRTWDVFEARTPVLTCTYHFGPGTANALAIGGKAGLFVISPPFHANAAAFDDLAQYGTVCALVASNAFHHLGLPEWKARFPDAQVFAPAQSIARVETKSGLTGIRTLADAGALAGDNLQLIDMPHYKTGEVLVRANTDRGRIWYVTDVIFNLPELPRNVLAQLVFRLSRSAPGLRLNNFAPLFMVKDKAALKRWLASEMKGDAPQWLIAAHGDVARIDSPHDTARKLFGT